MYRLVLAAWSNCMLITVTMMCFIRIYRHSWLSQLRTKYNRGSRHTSCFRTDNFTLSDNTDRFSISPKVATCPAKQQASGQRCQQELPCSKYSNNTDSSYLDFSSLSFIPLLAYFVFISVPKLHSFTHIFIIFRLAYLIWDLCFSMFVHLAILSYGFSSLHMRLYFRAAWPFILTILAVCIVDEVYAHSISPLRLVSVYSSFPANLIMCVVHVYFLLLDIALPLLLCRHVHLLSSDAVQDPLYMQTAYNLRPMGHFQRACFMVLQNCVMYKVCGRSVLRIVTLSTALLVPYQRAVYVHVLAFTIEVLMSLEPRIMVPKLPESQKLLHILMNPTTRKLFLKYGAHSGNTIACMSFLYDTSIYRLKIISAQTPKAIKQDIIALNSRWFLVSKFFPPEVVQKVNEKVITMILRDTSSDDMTALQEFALGIIALPERYALTILNTQVIPRFFATYSGVSIRTFNVLFSKDIVYHPRNFPKLLRHIYTLKADDKRIPSLITITSANPCILFIFPLFVSRATPSLEINRGYSAVYLKDVHALVSIGTVYRINCVSFEGLAKVLLEIAQCLCLDGSETSDTDALLNAELIQFVADLESICLHRRLFSIRSSYMLEYIKERIQSVVGSRSAGLYDTCYNSLLTKKSEKSHLNDSVRNEYLQSLRLSVTAQNRNLDQSVDNFLLTTFCPKLSVDGYKKTDSFETSELGRELREKPFIGRYLIKQTEPLQQPKYKLFQDFTDSEKQQLHSLLIPKHAFFNIENYIININTEISDSEYAIFQDCEIPSEKSISFQFAHSRDGMERSPRVSPKLLAVHGSNNNRIEVSSIHNKIQLNVHGRDRATIFNYIKLFRSVYSAFHHLNLISIYSIPPHSIAILCVRLSTNEYSAYYNSSTTLGLVRTIFLFTYSLTRDYASYLPKTLILAMLLAGLCSTFNHPGMSNSTLISSGHWLADVYANRIPVANFCTAMGWIAIVESGLLAHVEPSTRKEIRNAYISFGRKLAHETILPTYLDMQNVVSNKTTDFTSSALKMKLCELFMSYVWLSDQSYNKATAVYSSLNKYIDIQAEYQVYGHSVLEQDRSFVHELDFRALIPQLEIGKIACIAVPTLELIKTVLAQIAAVTAAEFDQTTKQIDLFIKRSTAAANMWAGVFVDKANKS